ncbi:MAG: S-methyl-5-thioribose-1-phosphate isomerase [Elusimicrobia bacterium]|nr:S-methyl-5-thioribose-1-phosphate isomerase [Elusimicrobiota bacterium]
MPSFAPSARSGSVARPPFPKDKVRHMAWDRGALRVLDQRELPSREVYLRCRTAPEVARAIRDMALRGAPLIGCAGAYGVALAAQGLTRVPRAAWRARLEQACRLLLDSRPTAVNLRYGVDRVRERARILLEEGADARRLAAALKAEADAFTEEDLECCRRMAELGADLLKRGSNVMTHCNAGALATAGLGTAVGVIRRAYQLGRVRHVYPCETRPYLQGSRLTLWELMRDGIPSTLITDNMAAHIMATEHIDAVIVGSDRIAANADVANKIGTYGLAILAKHHGIPFYVVAPSTTVDLRVSSGRSIPIEERSTREVVEVFGRSIAPAGARARHPAFDVTPHELVTAIVTEKGVVRPADGERLRRVLAGPASA